MDFGSPLKRDLGWCPDAKPAKRADNVSFHGPFCHVTACLEKTGTERKNRWCLMFITGSMMIITPVSHSAMHADPSGSKSSGELKPAQTLKRPLSDHDNDPETQEKLDNLVRQYYEADSDTVFVAEPGAAVIPLDTIKEITITWIRRSGHYSLLMFPFGMYPAEPANAQYRVNYQLAVTTGKDSLIFITPYSPELKTALRDLLGEKVREIPDEYAPLL
jgi:hypothetical protein